VRTEQKVFSISIAFGLLSWVLDALLEHLFFKQGPFLDQLLVNIPPHEAYMRSIVIFYCLVFGSIMASIVAKRERAERALQQVHSDLERQVAERTAGLTKVCGQLKKSVEERRQTEKALKTNENRFRQMFEKNLAVKLVIEPDSGAIVDANPAACKYYGYPLEVLKGMKISDINVLSPDQAGAEITLATSEQGDHFFFKHRLAAGEIRDVEVFSCPLDYGENQLLYSIVTDTTERKRAEEAVRESEERYRMLFNNAHDAIFVRVLTDQGSDAGFTEINDFASQLLGYSRAELRQLTPVDITAPEDLDKLPALMERILAEKHVVFNHRLMAKDGRIIPVELSSHLFDFKGQPTLLSIARDVTERQKTAEALQQSKLQLQGLSSQLMNAQENERSAIARELHDSIGQSLSAIKFRLETALLQVKPENVAVSLKSLEAIVPIVQDAVEEVRRICADLRPSLLDDLGIIATINWFCREFLKTYPHIRIDKHIAIDEQDIPPPLKIIIFRVVQEALHNVAKHSGANLVKLSLAKVDNQILTEITDNGAGFDLLEETSPDRLHSKGLGLTSMRERIELSGGAFVIHTMPGAGASIGATWPRSPLPRDDPR
jgi:PAS domain S-box-containing protein